MSLAAKSAGERTDTITSHRNNMFQPEAKESTSYRVEDVNMLILPPDFLYNEIRSLSLRRPNQRGEDLFRIIGSGIPGTAMPAWKGSLPDRDIWAMAHYIQSLSDIKDTPTAVKLGATLAADQGAWEPPSEAPAPEPPAAPPGAVPAP